MRWACDTEVGSRGAAALPIIFKAAIEVAATESDDGVGPANGPEHARLFKSRTDDGLATGLNDTRADKEVLRAKLGVAHALGVSFEVIRFAANLFAHLGIGGMDRAKRRQQLFDFALIEPALVSLCPDLLFGLIVRM